jgi:hypothetical protein
VLAVIFVLLAAALAAGLAGVPGRAGRPAAATAPGPPGHLQPMPPLVVVWTGSFRIEVVSARTGRVVRTLAADVGLYRGLPTVAVSVTGMVYFDTAAPRGQEQVMSVPLAGGPVTEVAEGRDPAVSPDGRRLAYVTDTDAGAPAAIVVEDLATRTSNRWATAPAGPDLGSLSWSPDGRFLAFTVSGWPPRDATVQVLGIRPDGTLEEARRIPLGHGLQWAGFLTTRTGMAVTGPAGPPGPGGPGLAEVAVSSGRILRQLTELPRQELSTSNAYDGTEGTITADPGGHYLLIATAGPDGHGEIFRWTVGTHQLVPLARGAIRASWAG